MSFPLEMSKNSLNDTERDLIAFLFERLRLPKVNIEQEYLATKMRFNLKGRGFKRLLDDMQNLHHIIYRDDSDEAIIESMKFHEFSNLLRMVSYSFEPGRVQKYRKVFHSLLHNPCKIRNLVMIIMKKLNKKQDRGAALFEVIETYLEEPYTILDYGSGLGYLSWQIAQEKYVSKIILLDIETIILDFAVYRFRKRGLATETIPVTKRNVYPELPLHNLCIATEVMEHLTDPLRAFRNIDKALIAGGLLIGDFSDHAEYFFHVSPDLSLLRDALRKYERVSRVIYRKPV